MVLERTNRTIIDMLGENMTPSKKREKIPAVCSPCQGESDILTGKKRYFSDKGYGKKFKTGR